LFSAGLGFIGRDPDGAIVIIKIPHFVQDFFYRAQDLMVFASLTHHNKLVLPKAPHGFAVTGFLLVCLGK
jgi:hypothetical protein